jgi:serine/threonine-protein kinase RsbW
MALDAPWTLTINSDLRLLSLARAFVEGVCKVAGFDDSTTHAIVLATDEAMNNVIRHAHHHQSDLPIQVLCYLRSEGIEILLHDQGAPFDITQVPHMDPGELRVGGRGVYLMRRLMDEVSTCPRGDCGNVLRMVKRCPPPRFQNAYRPSA